MCILVLISIICVSSNIITDLKKGLIGESQFKNKVVLVTGGSTGIGYATSLQIA